MEKQNNSNFTRTIENARFYNDINNVSRILVQVITILKLCLLFFFLFSCTSKILKNIPNLKLNCLLCKLNYFDYCVFISRHLIKCESDDLFCK